MCLIDDQTRFQNQKKDSYDNYRSGGFDSLLTVDSSVGWETLQPKPRYAQVYEKLLTSAVTYKKKPNCWGAFLWLMAQQTQAYWFNNYYYAYICATSKVL